GYADLDGISGSGAPRHPLIDAEMLKRSWVYPPESRLHELGNRSNLPRLIAFVVTLVVVLEPEMPSNELVPRQRHLLAEWWKPRARLQQFSWWRPVESSVG